MILFLFVYPNTSKAQTQNVKEDYIIQTQEIKQKTSRLSEIIPEHAQNIIKGENFEARIGFGDIDSSDYFSIMISTGSIDYGKLYPTTPISRDTEISVSPKSSHGYRVFTYEDHSLSDINFTNLIPNTTCDRGLCTKSTPAFWTENLTYGLGYSCVNITNSPCFDFEDDSFKRFADESKVESQEVIMNGYNTEDKARIIYKLNISPTQANSIYSNTVDFIAMPLI